MVYRDASVPRIEFRDFAPAFAKSRVIGEPGLCDDFASAVEAANQWIHDQQIDVVNIETVLLPDMHARGGTGEGQLFVSTVSGGYWYQFVRIWFRGKR